MHDIRPPAGSPRPFRTFAFLDGLLALCLLAAGAVFVPLMQSRAPAEVVVHVDDRIAARYPLSAETSFEVDGTIGPLTIRVHNKGVSVTHATCPRGICVASGTIHLAGQQIVCVPNHVIVEISSRTTPDRPDAITQ
jgi:hypothetical protein